MEDCPFDSSPMLFFPFCGRSPRLFVSLRSILQETINQPTSQPINQPTSHARTHIRHTTYDIRHMSCISLCVYFYISILGCFAGVFPWTLFLPQCRSHRCEPGRRLISVNSGSKMKLCGQTASAKSVLPRPASASRRKEKEKARYHIEALMINRTGLCAHHVQPRLVFWCVSACQN